MLNPKSKEYLIYMRMFFLIWIKDTCMYKLLKKKDLVIQNTSFATYNSLSFSYRKVFYQNMFSALP